LTCFCNSTVDCSVTLHCLWCGIVLLLVMDGRCLMCMGGRMVLIMTCWYEWIEFATKFKAELDWC
jgi:hypothetical protein